MHTHDASWLVAVPPRPCRALNGRFPGSAVSRRGKRGQKKRDRRAVSLKTRIFAVWNLAIF